jgi:hypothetical protein
LDLAFVLANSQFWTALIEIMSVAMALSIGRTLNNEVLYQKNLLDEQKSLAHEKPSA